MSAFQGNTAGHTTFAKCNSQNQALFSVNAGISCEEALEHASLQTDCINKLTLQAGMNDDSSAAWAAHYLGDIVKAIIDDVTTSLQFPMEDRP
ncbi:DUF3077 domain-containing protein [Pseudomonas amygdali]|uniref:DUF3077 domain-containing protein n=1 Tax=Pseudomonas amygdali pv. hibisci TaxID=251723 RepID=A0AB34TYW9_PSEA0|nr:DUF3077 domain-containing protein [Pseudomonas amygdali]KPX50606.1 Uncharacterized protein ALO67_01611 [Pseudomonas amygdali pv. hibisci]RMN60279.1 hypothetical protein ALQ57_01069 [Pseudomonas amygdali pv. hibisci]UBT76731.1 DUF3077 domain-containing protein [Pseudomonas amygdali]